jgi:hypothetical protein
MKLLPVRSVANTLKTSLTIMQAPAFTIEDPKHNEVYLVWEELGKGSFGAVYRAKKKDQPDSSFAIKDISLFGVNFVQNDREREKNRAMILNEASHRRVVLPTSAVFCSRCDWRSTCTAIAALNRTLVTTPLGWHQFQPTYY